MGREEQGTILSLVLNCENYYFTNYTSGTDIVMQDTYMIGNNVTFSSQWGTVCTEDYGDCGCDNCKGSFQDISARMDEFRSRLFINGWERTKAVWTVPQGFGNDTYWKREPTDQEFVVESINHGALGKCYSASRLLTLSYQKVRFHGTIQPLQTSKPSHPSSLSQCQR